jgi:tRNA (adenine22-N1)-methyltransferase
VGYYSPVLHPNSRLGLIASQISPDAKAVLDVGYDHGKILAHLAQSRPALKLIGGEVVPDLKVRFEDHYGPGVADLRTGSGLTVATPGEVDVVVMAGLTDKTMLRLLVEGRDHLPHLKQLICCPPALEFYLRPGLASLGMRITAETIAFKRHRSYDIIVSEPGEVTEAPHPWGPTLIARRDPLLTRHLEIQRHLFRRDFDSDMRSHRQPDGSLDLMGRKLSLLDDLLDQFRSAGH